MKSISFCAAILFTCGFTASSFSQDSSGSSKDPLAFSDVPTVPNPFDFGQSKEEDSNDGLQLNSSGSSSSKDAAPTAPKNDSAIPGGKPVGNYGHSVGPPTNVDLTVLSMTPHIRQTPVQWSHHARTPDPVGEMMLREFCSRGLWDGYSAERAAECACMHRKLEKCRKKGCQTGCSSCSGCSTCSSCNSCAKPVNRYRVMHHVPQQTHCATLVSPQGYPQRQSQAIHPRLVPPQTTTPTSAQMQNIANRPSGMQR